MRIPNEQEPEIVNVLRKHPDGATVETLAQALGLTEAPDHVRDRIDSARYGPGKYNIVNVNKGFKTFKLMPGVYRRRSRG